VADGRYAGLDRMADRPEHTWVKHPGPLVHRLRLAKFWLTLPKTGDETFDRQIALTLSFEGSGLNDSRETTGELSRYGVSLASFPELGEQGVIDLTADQAVEVYYSGTLPSGVKKPFGWLHYGFDKWPEPPAAKCFDMTVNPGAGNGLKTLQRAMVATAPFVDVSVAGWKDPKLQIMVRQVDAGALLAAIRHELVRYYTDRVAAGKVSPAYLDGLLRRARS
jgi:hypothetical protein